MTSRVLNICRIKMQKCSYLRTTAHQIWGIYKDRNDKEKSRSEWNIECKCTTEKSTKLRFGSLKGWINLKSPYQDW